MRLNIVAWSAEEHRVIWTYHHALIDGRSLALLLGELWLFYEARSAGRELDLPLPRPYREYIELLRGLDLVAAEAYWRRQLSGFSAPTPLGIDRGRYDEEQQGPQGSGSIAFRERRPPLCVPSPHRTEGWWGSSQQPGAGRLGGAAAAVQRSAGRRLRCDACLPSAGLPRRRRDGRAVHQYAAFAG